MSEIRASRNPSLSKISFAALTSRALVSAPLRDRGPLGFSLASGRVVDTPRSLRAGSLLGGVNVPSPFPERWWTRGSLSISRVLPLQEKHTGGRSAAGGHHRRRRAGNLPLTGVVPEL